MATPDTGLPALLEEISVVAHVPVQVLEESLEALGPHAMAEPQPAIALSRYMLEQQPRLKGCVEHVWRAAALWLSAAGRATVPAPSGTGAA